VRHARITAAVLAAAALVFGVADAAAHDEEDAHGGDVIRDPIDESVTRPTD
jgi:hypothetical protein